MMNGGLFWELRQQRDISYAQDAAQHASRKTTDLTTEIKALRNAIDKLLLINRALWEIMAEKNGLNDEYLTQKVNEIDLRDGKLDGKVTTAVRQCASCGKTIFAGHQKCLYCGAECGGANPLDAIHTGEDNAIRHEMWRQHKPRKPF